METSKDVKMSTNKHKQIRCSSKTKKNAVKQILMQIKRETRKKNEALKTSRKSF